MTASQITTIKALTQGDLTATVKSAITNYNLQSSITFIPCTNGTTNETINDGSTNTYPETIATVQGSNGPTAFYALGHDSNLYQLSNQFSLLNPLSLGNGTQVLAIVGSNAHLFLLLAQPSKGSKGYSVGVLLPGQTTLKSEAPIQLQNLQLIPDLISAWGNDLYVMLVPPSSPANNSSNEVILDYTLKAGKAFNPNVSSTPIATSVSIKSMSAYPGRQLFLLLQDGEVQNVSLSNPHPASVLVQHPLAVPLSVSDQDFRGTMAVPTTTPVPQSGSANISLTVLGAVSLTVGVSTANTSPHLYIVDQTNRRVLDLVVNSLPTTVTPTATPNGNGGSVATAAGNVTLQLQQQYVSTDLFASLKGMSVDPKGAPFYTLTQSAQASSTALNLVSITPALLQGCA